MKSGLVLALVLSFAVPTLAQRDRFCATCKGTGWTPCEKSRCEKQKCLFEGDHLCEDQLGLKCCMGLRKHPCKICKRRVKDHELEIERRQRWLALLKKQRKDMKIKKMVRVVSDEFDLLWDIKRIKVGQITYDRKKGAHLYVKRLHEARAKYEEWFGRIYRMPQGPWRVYITKNDADANRVRATIGSGSATNIFGPTPLYITADPARDDEGRHAAVVHHISHHFAKQGFNHGKGLYPGWWDVGVARFMEIEGFEETRHSCTGEVNSKALEQWQTGTWRGKVYSRVNREKALKLSSFAKKGLKQMNYMEHAFAWSYVDYVAHEHKDKAERVAHGLTSGKTTAQVLREVLGMSLSQFHDAWRAWVRKTYSSR